MSRTSSTTKASRSRGRGVSPTGEAWGYVLAVFFSSRILFMGVGALAVVLLPGATPAGEPLEPTGIFGYWAHWDGAWYSEIATDGYDARFPASTAFFPLFPMLVRLGAAIAGGPAIWGVGISLISTVFALFFLYRIGEHLFDRSAARAATLCFAFFPTAFFLNAVYTEALFLALTMGAVWAGLVRRDLLLAGILGALAAATRNVGVLLLIPLGLEWLRNRREFGGGALASLALIPAGLIGYAAFLWGRFDAPLVFLGQQEEYWGRTLTNPIETFGNAWTSAREGLQYVFDPGTLFFSASAGPSLAASNTLNLIFLALFSAVLLAGLFVLRPGLWLYAFVLAALPILTPSPNFPLMSLPRFVLAAFPVFLVLGALLSRTRAGLAIWLIASGVLGVALTALFATWRWVA